MLCEGKKTKTLGRRYPKAVLPNVSNPLSTKAFPAKTLGCEGKIEKYCESNQKYFRSNKNYFRSILTLVNDEKVEHFAVFHFHFYNNKSVCMIKRSSLCHDRN